MNFDHMLAPLNIAVWQMLVSLWPLWVCFGLIVAFQLSIAYIKQRRIAQSGISEIDTMDGITFERYLEALFRQLGYHAERTRASGDFGADVIISKDGVRTIVQAKRQSKNVGVKAVQEVVAAQKMYNGTKTMVVTNSNYTNPARQLADANRVELWDRERLVSAILLVRKNK